MKRLATFLIGAIALIVGACSSNDLYDDMPSKIQSFISQYYPNSELESFTSFQNNYTAIIKNGPTMRFNSQCNWTYINGNGSPLPQVLLFNDLPPALYEYLQEVESTNQVFVMWRDDKTYSLQLLNDAISYNISTGEITGKHTTPTGNTLN